MKEFTEAMRYEYPLTKDSVVIDAGGYEGNFAKWLHERYGCRIYVFEPVRAFYLTVIGRVPDDVSVVPRGIGGTTRMEEFHVQNDSTGKFAGSPNVETVQIQAIEEVLGMLRFDVVDLLKLNIEGMEFEVLERIIELGLAPRFRNIQVQFHTCAPDWERRYAAIAEGLGKTHELTYRAPFCWENWALRAQ